jgi:hypothetical protein
MSAGYSPVNTWDERAGKGSIRENIWDYITNIDPTETQLSSGLGTVDDVKSVHYEWVMDTLAAGATVYKNAEGFTPNYNDVTNTDRADNYCQNISAEVKVTDTAKRVATVGQYENDLARQKANALKVLKNRIETSLMAGSIATGSSTEARGMAGLKDTTHWNITGHAILTTNESGASLSESKFNDYLANLWNNAKIRADECYVGSKLKRRISGFTAGSTKNVDAEDKRLVNAVDVYESDFGIVKLFMHFYANQGATNQDLVLINSDMVKIGFLVDPEYKTAGKTGSFEAGWYETEVTLRINDPRSVHVTKNLL